MTDEYNLCCTDCESYSYCNEHYPAKVATITANQLHCDAMVLVAEKEEE